MINLHFQIHQRQDSVEEYAGAVLKYYLSRKVTNND